MAGHLTIAHEVPETERKNILPRRERTFKSNSALGNLEAFLLDRDRVIQKLKKDAIREEFQEELKVIFKDLLLETKRELLETFQQETSSISSKFIQENKELRSKIEHLIEENNRLLEQQDQGLSFPYGEIKDIIAEKEREAAALRKEKTYYINLLKKSALELVSERKKKGALEEKLLGKQEVTKRVISEVEKIKSRFIKEETEREKYIQELKTKLELELERNKILKEQEEKHKTNIRENETLLKKLETKMNEIFQEEKKSREELRRQWQDSVNRMTELRKKLQEEEKSKAELIASWEKAMETLSMIQRPWWKKLLGIRQ